MGIPYMVVSLFVHLYVFVTSCAQYKHEAQSLVVHSWSQHPENPTVGGGWGHLGLKGLHASKRFQLLEQVGSAVQ